MITDYPLISADTHLCEPMELYDRLPAVNRHRAPHIEHRADGRHLVFEGQIPFPIEAPNPLKPDDQERYWRDEEEGDVGRVHHRAGGTDVNKRIRDQAADGVSAEVIYPNGTRYTHNALDPEFQLQLAHLFNDYYHELFHSHLDRFVVSAPLPMLDVDNAIAEAQRVAHLGFRSLSIPLYVPSSPYNLPKYERFWSAVEELGLPLSIHVFGITSGNQKAYHPGPGEDLAFEIIDMASAMKPMCILIASGVLQNHPRLRFVLVESGIGWLAWVLQTLDQMHEKRHMWIEPRLDLKPSEYFKRQGAATFCDDAVGIGNRYFTGSDCLMWGNDYPHDEGTYPRSRQVIERLFKDVPAEAQRKILYANAARFYSFD